LVHDSFLFDVCNGALFRNCYDFIIGSFKKYINLISDLKLSLPAIRLLMKSGLLERLDSDGVIWAGAGKGLLACGELESYSNVKSLVLWARSVPPPADRWPRSGLSDRNRNLM